MKKNVFGNFVTRLMEVDPTESPIISCFVNLDQPLSDYFKEFEVEAAAVSRRLEGDRLLDFEDALEEIKKFLTSKIRPSSRGIAIYCRSGHNPLLIPMQFEVPFQNDFIVDDLPHIYPLIELKDTYHRFVIAIVTENESRILETTIGAVTEDFLERKPDLRSGIGGAWSKECNHGYGEEQANRFVHEQVGLIEDLMKRGGHNHLILAGSPQMVARLKKALPPRLNRKVIDTLRASLSRDTSPIVADSINLFVEMEDNESHDRIPELESAVWTNRQGVCGFGDSLQALEEGAASILIIDQEYLDPESRELLVRMAASGGLPIETVSRNEAMASLGGVGCILRYRPSPVREQRMVLAS